VTTAFAGAVPLSLARNALFPMEDLGAPLRASYRYSVDMGLLRTPFESGAVRQRRKYLNQPAAMSLAWDFNTSQVARFAGFADVNGYAWFDMELPTIQTPGTFADPPVYLTPISLRFSTNYVVTATGFDRFKVEVGAEVASMRSLQDFLRLYWSDDGKEFYFADDAAGVFLGRV
jgi:hypothetical protein